MNTKELIGQTITDIFLWSEMEVGGLDKAQVYIELENNKTIGIPWDFESENLERKPRKGSESVFADLSDIPVYHVNSEGKSIGEIAEAKKKRESSILGRIKKALGITEVIPREYQPYKIEYKENELKHLKNQKIVNFLMIENSDSVGFLVLENGYIISETDFSPHGTGMAGLEYYQSIEEFEESYETDFKRLIASNSN